MVDVFNGRATVSAAGISICVDSMGEGVEKTVIVAETVKAFRSLE
jgi:hypothetical protein